MHHILFICGSFNDTDSRLDYTASNGQDELMNWTGYGRKMSWPN
jgi:hypothetical protein